MNNVNYSSYVTQELAGICFKNKTGYVALITNNSESSETIKILKNLYKHFHSSWRGFWQLLNCMQQSSGNYGNPDRNLRIPVPWLRHMSNAH
jgi:hypothetical protein